MGIKKYNIFTRKLIEYDVVVCGGGFAGVAAAVSAARNGAKTLLVESGGVLGGTITQSIVPQILDPGGKGGIVKEIYALLNANGHTVARRGERYDEQGNQIPGTVVDLEFVKLYLERICSESNVTVIYHSTIAHLETLDGHIQSALVVTEAGNYMLQAKIFIDATGNGNVAALAGCGYQIGHPESGNPQPCSMSLIVTGLNGFDSTNDWKDKAKVKKKFEEFGIEVSAEGIALIRCANPDMWLLHFNNQYDVFPDDIIALSEATSKGRLECLRVLEQLKKIPGNENVALVASPSHIGIREGRRINGQYKLLFEDVVSGARFDDGICLVEFGIDVHQISEKDREDHTKGRRVKAYNIPYRSLLPVDCDNLILAGRCISGDFYAHASYRVVGNVIPMGEAAGYAAAECVKEMILPKDVSGKSVSEYMKTLGYKI